MTKKTIIDAVKAAEEFLAAAKCVLELTDEGWTICGSRETGTVRRKSMDLTRALADMRKPNGAS